MLNRDDGISVLAEGSHGKKEGHGRECNGDDEFEGVQFRLS
jgi:hypothetical protein